MLLHHTPKCQLQKLFNQQTNVLIEKFKLRNKIQRLRSSVRTKKQRHITAFDQCQYKIGNCHKTLINFEHFQKLTFT